MPRGIAGLWWQQIRVPAQGVGAIVMATTAYVAFAVVISWLAALLS